MPPSGQPAEVTGLKPGYGPESGGDNIKVFGTDLGTSREDIIDVKFNGYSCGAANITWISSTKLECNLPPGRGKGAVVVTTRSGGEGSTSAQFTYEAASDGEEEEEEEDGIDPLTEHDVWLGQFDFAPEPKANFVSKTSNDPLELNGRGKKIFVPSGVTVPAIAEAYGQYGYSASLTDEAFKPACCLTNTYLDATDRELTNGLQNLRASTVKKGNSQKVLLKNHVSTFIACFDAVSEVHGLITAKGGGQGITVDLEQVIERISRMSSELYQPMLDRRRKCERERTALAVLNNYKYLFSLPKDLMLKLREEDWAAVIQGYERAKSAKSQTSIAVFAEILDVIETIIERVRERLFTMLAEGTRSHDELSRIIGHLHELGSEEDPGWFCLIREKGHVMLRLGDCVESLTTNVEAADELATATQLARWDVIKARVKSARIRSSFSQSSFDHPGGGSSRQSSASLVSVAGVAVDAIGEGRLTRNESHHESTEYLRGGLGPSISRQSLSAKPITSGIYGGGRRTGGREAKMHPAVSFIEDLSRVVNEQLPAMWKLGLASLQRMANGAEDSGLATLDIDTLCADTEEGAALAILDRKAEFETHIKDVVDSYATKIRVNVMDVQTDTLAGGEPQPVYTWLPLCEAQIRKCLGLLSALGMSETCISGLASLSADFQRHTVREVFAECATDAKALQSEENWEPSANGLHTSLPDLFGSIIGRGIAALSELCSARTDVAKFVFDTDEEGEQLMCNVLSAFTTVLDRLAYETGNQSNPSSPIKSSHRSKASLKKKTTPPEKRWMLVMSNCLYTRQTIVPMVARKYDSLRLGMLDMPFDDEIRVLEDLDYRCFESLLNQRATLLQPLLLQCVTELPDASAMPLRSVRSYTKKILLQLIQVHADVAAYARPFIKRVISQLLIRVAKNFHTMISNFELLGQDPAADIEQLQVEMYALKRILVKFDREPSVWAAAEELLGRLAPPKKKKSLPTPPVAAARASPTAESTPKKGGRSLPKAPGGRSLPKVRGGRRKSLPKPPPGRSGRPNSGSRRAHEAGAAAQTMDDDALPGLPPTELGPVAVAEDNDLEASIRAFLRATRFQHACFSIELEDKFDVDVLSYDDAEIKTALEEDTGDGCNDDDDDDFV
mmetsp:Transcript_11737/g.30154  ORF Transcript_11737/g.30154 Transcript_11737/m.30154 type:complete len:1131 (-) Transcript_11737:1427-4819(-)